MTLTEWQAQRLQVARDYLLEHWTPDPIGTPTYFTHLYNGQRAGEIYDAHLAEHLPHYSMAGSAFPRFTRRQIDLLAQIGIKIEIMPSINEWPIGNRHITLVNWS